MQVEITIKVLGSENETAEQLLTRVGGLLKNQPSILVEQRASEAGTAAKVSAAPELVRKDPLLEPEAPKKKRGRPRKDETTAVIDDGKDPVQRAIEKATKEARDDEELEEEFGDGDDNEAWLDEEFRDEDEGEADEPEDEEPVKAKEKTKSKKAPRLTLEGDIIPAFRTLTSKHGNPAGGEILKKFGVQSVRDLGEDEYEDVLTVIQNYQPAAAVKRRPKQ